MDDIDDSGFEVGGGYDYSPPNSLSFDIPNNSGFEAGGGFDYSLDAPSDDDNQIQRAKLAGAV